MKVGLILAGNIWFAPYVSNYINILDKYNVDYEIISWNRDGRDDALGFQYNEELLEGAASLKSYWRYTNFIRRIVNQEKFDKLILFGSQISILLSDLLLKYKRRYIVDYRDLSIEQKIGLKQIFSFILSNSYANVISSPGFKKCLPKSKYYISHNFNIKKVKESLNNNIRDDFNKKNDIDILTIGGIRDYTSNIEVVKSLSNILGFTCRFVGKGIASKRIEDFCKENNIGNASFYGYYPKEEESIYIEESTFLNIFYPRVISHDTAMSNRFYNSLIYKRPMIVTKHTTQGDYVEKYKVGIAIENCQNLKQDILEFLDNDFEEYSQNCNKLLSLFLEDEKKFQTKVKDFLS